MRKLSGWECYVEDYPEGCIRTTLWSDGNTNERFWRSDYMIANDEYISEQLDANKHTKDECVAKLRAKIAL